MQGVFVFAGEVCVKNEGGGATFINVERAFGTLKIAPLASDIDLCLVGNAVVLDVGEGYAGKFAWCDLPALCSYPIGHGVRDCVGDENLIVMELSGLIHEGFQRDVEE